jgi:hypothetical protein
MGDFGEFLKAVLSHWGWLTAGVIGLLLSGRIGLVWNDKAKIACIVIAIGCFIVALYLALHEQYRALNEYLRSG